MDTQKTGLLLCGECKGSKFLSQGNENSRFLTLHVSMPAGTDADMIDLLAKNLCFEHYKRKEDVLTRVDAASLHTSNRLLSEEEERFCTFHRKEAKRELSALEDVVSATGQVKIRREHLKSLISQFDKFLSPARQVPKEVVTEVARYMIAEEDPKIGSLDMRSAIWTLSHVCSSWRTFILSTPIFWSNLKMQGKQSRFAPSILLQCINRSQSAPLDVLFKSMETETSRVLLQLICSVSHRWRSLDLRIHGCHWSCLEQVRNTLTELESLSINIMDISTVDISKTTDIFAFTPKLRTVRLGMIHATPHYLRFPSKNLIEFQLWLNEKWLTHIPAIIPRSAVTLVLAAPGDFDLCPPTITPSIYPNATNLRVGKPWLLDFFTCPKLDTLELSCLDITNEFMDNQFFPFLARSTPTLSKLRLHALGVPSDDLLRQVYQTMHTISELIISTERYDENSTHLPSLFEPLLFTSDRSKDLLPRLTTLTVEFTAFWPEASLYRLIHSVVKSRANPPNDYHGEKLRYFTFSDEKTSSTDTKITLATYNDLDRLARECTPLSD